MTRREKLLKDAEHEVLRFTARRENAIDLLMRADAKLKEWSKVAERHRRALAKPAPVKAEPVTPVPYQPGQSMASKVDDVLHPEEPAIPTFLQRKKEGERKDAEAAAAIRAEQDQRKSSKTRTRIEKMKAGRSGETKRMPLTGRDALAFINQG